MTKYTMNRDFDFDSIGKRLPYSAPEGHLDHFEDNVFARINAASPDTHATKRRTPHLRIVARWAAAAAAAAVVIVLSVTGLRPTPQPVTASDVETAFCQLSTEDQNFLLSVYQDDVFLSDELSTDANQ